MKKYKPTSAGRRDGSVIEYRKNFPPLKVTLLNLLREARRVPVVETVVEELPL